MVKIDLSNDSGETATVNLKPEELNRFYDAGSEFGIELTEKQIVNILKEYPKIAFDAFIWGNDTCVGDEFFDALVESIVGENWEQVKKSFKDKAHETVKSYAKIKGYKLVS